MSSIFLAILLPSIIAEEFFEPASSNSFHQVRPFLQKWSSNDGASLLTVVLDDYQQEPYTLDVPDDLLNTLNVSVKLVTLKQLVRLKYKNMNRDYESFDPGSCVLVLFHDIQHLKDVFNSPHLVSFWQPDNLYILYDNSGQFVDWFDLQRFFQWGFEKLWRFRRIFRVLVFVNGKTIRYNLIDFAGYHTRYFFNSSCDWYCVKNNQDSILMINEPNDTDVSDFFEKRRDFKLYPMKISIFRSSTMSLHEGKYSGMDYRYLEEVTRMMNVTPILMRSVERYGWEENGVFFGTVGHLVYQLADVSFNQVFVKDYLTRQVEFTTVVTSDMICALVPKAPPIPDHAIIVKIFSPEAWLLIFLGYFIILVITVMLKDKRNRDILNNLCNFEQRHFCEEIIPETGTVACFIKEENASNNGAQRRTNRKWRRANTGGKYCSKQVSDDFSSRVLLFGKYAVEMYLQLMQPFNLKRVWFPERLLLMCCMLMNVILNGVFTSQLASNFSKRMYYKDIDTLEELEKSGLPILTTSRDLLDDVFKDFTSPLLKQLQQRLRYANDSESDSKLFLTKDAAVLNRLASIPLKYNDYETIRNMHVVKECPKHYVVGFLMTKGSPFRERINNILGRLNNGGFHGKWYRAMFQSQRRSHQQKETEHRKITIKHMFIPFVILQVGLASSAIVFVCERRQNNL